MKLKNWITPAFSTAALVVLTSCEPVIHESPADFEPLADASIPADKSFGSHILPATDRVIFNKHSPQNIVPKPENGELRLFRVTGFRNFESDGWGPPPYDGALYVEEITDLNEKIY